MRAPLRCLLSSRSRRYSLGLSLATYLAASLYPSFQIKTIRGNIQTRLAKLDEHDDYDAIIVAACGFRRGGLGARIDELLSVETFGYGVGQGSIGIECRADDAEVSLSVLSVGCSVSLLSFSWYKRRVTDTGPSSV